MRLITGFSQIAPSCSAILCDVWGVLHNGVAPYAAAVAALAAFRAGGGTVLLVSNAPRPAGSVVDQLDRIGVARAAYDDVLTSGDVARTLIARRPGEPLLHIGPERDLPLFEGLDAPRADAAEARYIVCTGLVDDETETAADYLALLAAAHRRGLPMICANPDLVVHRGGREVPCAGVIGAAYEAMGGAVIYPGKPYAPVYDMALVRLADLRGAAVDKAQILAVGDAIRTDIAGAARFGLPSLLVMGGIHAGEMSVADEAGLTAWLARQEAVPQFVMAEFAW